MEAKHNEEIDLMDLAVSAIRFIQKNLKFILICTVLGLSSSGVGYFLLPKSYHGRLILGSNILNDAYGTEIAESLRTLVQEKNYNGLAFYLGVDKEVASKLKSLEVSAKSLSPSAKKDELENEQEYTIFTLTVKVSDGTQLPALQEGFIRFFRNNEFLKTRSRQRTEMYQKLVNKIGIEINALDSLKKRLFEGRLARSKNGEMLLLAPSEIFSTLVELNKEQLELKNAMELSDGLQVVEGFIGYEKPLLKPLALVVVGILGGFIFALVFLSFSALLKAANTPKE